MRSSVQFIILGSIALIVEVMVLFDSKACLCGLIV